MHVSYNIEHLMNCIDSVLNTDKFWLFKMVRCSHLLAVNVDHLLLSLMGTPG